MACLFVDQLTVIDCAYLDAARGLVGESWIVDLELEGDLDAQSMVLDFGEVKRRIKRAIDAGPDHTLLVPLQHPALHWEARGEQPALHFESARGRIRHISPRCALTLLPVETVSAEALGRHLVEQLQALLPGNAQQLRLHLRPEGIDGAHYHYVHGLKKHDGACQRIAHGHRSRLADATRRWKPRSPPISPMPTSEARKTASARTTTICTLPTARPRASSASSCPASTAG
jgi:6-pyruvoyl-tetrahydropterin synthase